MNTYQILNSCYIYPLLWSGISGDKKALAALKSLGVSVNQVEKMRRMRSLMSYHNLPNNRKKRCYNMLRDGLREYFREELRAFWKKAGITKKIGWLMLDYGCGSGSYSYAFKAANPKSTTLLVDRQGGDINIDFQQNPGWYGELVNSVNVVLLSEVLHCKNQQWRDYLITSSYQMLKKNGLLVINENDDLIMAWRLESLSSGGDALSKKDILTLTRSKFTLEKHEQLNRHHIYVLRKR